MHHTRLSKRLISPSVTAANHPAAPRFPTSIARARAANVILWLAGKKKKRVDCTDIEHSSPRTFLCFKVTKWVVTRSRYYRSDATIRAERDLKVINTARTNDPDGPFEIESSRLRIYLFDSRSSKEWGTFHWTEIFDLYDFSPDTQEQWFQVPIIQRAVPG